MNEKKKKGGLVNNTTNQKKLDFSLTIEFIRLSLKKHTY